MIFKPGYEPTEKACARCGQPFPVTRFHRARMCPACACASYLESARASSEARRRRKAKAAEAWR